MPLNKASYFINTIWWRYWSVFLLALLVTTFWWQSLAYGKIIIHSDAAHLGLSLLTFLSQFLSGDREISWESGIYGGHPLFAESQGGFLNPINVFSAFFFDPQYGIGINHWLSMLISGLGVYKLCRILDINRPPAAFAGLAVIFSGSWLGFQYNISVSGTLAWVPWLLAAVEHWLKKPDFTRSVYIATAAALVIFAGYPHLAHGSAIYIAARLTVYPFYENGRIFIRSKYVFIIKFGLLAVIMALGLSAIQLLPLIELVFNSHRDDGIELAIGEAFNLKTYLQRVLVYSESPTTVFDTLSSICVAFFTGCIVLVRPSAAIVGHAIGTFLLFNLGMEFSSPFFRFLYEHHMILGLHNYRFMFPFFPLAVIGASVLAAFAIDRLSRINLNDVNWRFYVVGVFYILTFIAACYYSFSREVPKSNLISFTILPAGLFVILYLKSMRSLPCIALLAISAEVLFTKIDTFNFYDPSILEMPASMQAILDSDIENYKATINSVSPAMVFIPANDPQLGPAYTRFLKTISPFPGLLWGIPSIDGVLGLELKGRALIGKTIERELNGVSPTSGNRVIDTLGVKYISRDSTTSAPGFEIIHHDIDDSVLIYRNNYAKPKFRVYQKASPVATSQEALTKLTSSEIDELFITTNNISTFPRDIECRSCSNGKCAVPAVNVNQASSTFYKVTVQSECGVWLFIADANYPGWSATIDGNTSTVYTAQVLGKAVYVPAGHASVELNFRSWSIYVGALISVTTFLFIALFLVARMRGKYIE